MVLILSVVCLLMALFIIVINTLALVVIAKFRSLWTPSNICIASLAAGDLMVGVVLAHLFVLMTVQEEGFSNTVLCVVCQVLIVMASEVTALQSVMVSVDRYLAVAHPYYYETHVTNKTVKVSVLVVWVVAGLLCGAVFVILMEQHGSTPLCTRPWPPAAVLLLAPPFYLSIPVCGVLYALISRVALRHQRTIALQRGLACAQHLPLRETFLQKMRATKMFFVVFGLYFVFLLPFMTAISISFTVRVPVYLKQVFVLLNVVKSGFNVLIYLFLNQDFRAAFKRLLTKR